MEGHLEIVSAKWPREQTSRIRGEEFQRFVNSDDAAEYIYLNKDHLTKHSCAV